MTMMRSKMLYDPAWFRQMERRIIIYEYFDSSSKILHHQMRIAI